MASWAGAVAESPRAIWRRCCCASAGCHGTWHSSGFRARGRRSSKTWTHGLNEGNFFQVPKGKPKGDGTWSFVCPAEVPSLFDLYSCTTTWRGIWRMSLYSSGHGNVNHVFGFSERKPEGGRSFQFFQIFSPAIRLPGVARCSGIRCSLGATNSLCSLFVVFPESAECLVQLACSGQSHSALVSSQISLCSTVGSLI